MLLSPASASATLGLPGLWSKLTGRGKNNQKFFNQAQMSLSRQRLCTLAHGEMETVRMLPASYADLDAVARDWIRPPPEAAFALRIPTEYASFQAARYINGPYIWINSEEAYQIAILGVQGTRIEIVSDAPPPPDEPPPPPPPPVLEMEGIFNLELNKNQHVAIDVTVSSDELDMSRTEDGTTVAGMFWGKLDIVHDGDIHKMEFSGTRLQDQSPEFLFDSRVMSKLTVAAKPTTAKCTLTILSPTVQYCDVNITLNALWNVGMTWPPADRLPDNKFKYFVRVHPGGALEHFDTETVVTSLYYEAIPDSASVDPHAYVAPYNSFAMPFIEFIANISKIMESLGLKIHARTNFINNNMAAFSAHKNIAFRFMSPSRLSSAIDLQVTLDPCVYTRLFLMFRGVSDEEMGDFAAAGEKEAINYNWRDFIGWTEAANDNTQFRVLEVSVLEVS